MNISLDLRKTLEENASTYFEQAKKARSKIAGAQKAIEKAKVEKERQVEVTSQMRAPKKIRKKAWYEKYKWFVASNGMIIIGGKDASTNETLIKKHTEPTDIIFHTDAPGSPFVVIKTQGQEIPEEVLQQAADFTACHSKAWRAGQSETETYWVGPEQVTKEAKAGEYMSRGAFMVYGKRHYLRVTMKLAATLFEDKIMIGPLSALASQKPLVVITQGTMKTSDAAKAIIRLLGAGEPDDILPGLPSGGCSVTAR